MGPVLDPTSSVTKVLSPGERLIWVGQPTRTVALPATRYLVMMAVGLGYLIEALVAYYAGPLPVLSRIELFVVGALLISPLWFLSRHDRDTTYAVTNRRLLMAVGPDRRQVREVTLEALVPVQVRYRYRYGIVLDFRKRGPGSRTPVWTFLDSGKPDKWYTPWSVDNPESVRQLIENAQNNYWFGSRENLEANPR
jgi:hypothetical protein